MQGTTTPFEQAGFRLLEAFGDAVLGFDASGCCVHAGACAGTLLSLPDGRTPVGLAIGDILKRRASSLPSWDECLGFLARQPDGIMQSELEILVRPDGSEMPVALVLHAWAEASGGPMLLVAVRDLTEKSRQSKAFHASVKSFRALMDGVSDAIFFLSRQGRVVDANQGVEGMFGYPPALFQGKSIDNLLDLEIHARGHLADAVPAVIGGRASHIEFMARNRRGESFPAEIYLYPSEYFNQPVAMAIVHDISERRRQEAALMAARDLAEQSSRLKGEIIRNMSHEFRTPLAAMIGMGDLLGDTDLDEEQRAYLAEAKDGARRLLEMVNAILDLAKLEAGQYRPQAIDFCLADILGEQVRRFAAACQAKGLVLRSVCAPGLPDMVSGDMDGINKLLSFLVDNAIKFTDAGEIVLAAEPGDAPDVPPGGCTVRIAVRDTGIGIPADMQERIFDGFVQADGSATRKHGGIGLGLGIASRLAAVLGGRLQVDSAVGQGSQFHFTLALGPSEF